MSELVCGEGGRVWMYKDGKFWYFFEEKYLVYGNFVLWDIVIWEIFDVCVNQKFGINGENMVYFDFLYKDLKEFDVKFGGIIEIYEKFMGDDLCKFLMKIFFVVYYLMGGLWVDYDQMISICGLFAVGECDYLMYGGNCLGVNFLFFVIYGGMVVGLNVVKYVLGFEILVEDMFFLLFDFYVKKEEEKWVDIMKMDGDENVYVFYCEFGEWMMVNVMVVCYNDKFLKMDDKI